MKKKNNFIHTQLNKNVELTTGIVQSVHKRKLAGDIADSTPHLFQS